MDVIDKITQAIEAPLDAQGYRLVLVKLADADGRKTLTIMAERLDGAAMGVKDCTNISRTTGALLDVADPIPTAYDLEVCSPGLDRPLVKLEDFKRHTDYEVKLETQIPLNNRRRFRGIVNKVDGNNVHLTVDNENVIIDFTNIRNAKLVLNDALVNGALKKKAKKQ